MRGARVEPPDVRLAERQRPGLVEDDGIDLAQQLERPSVLDQQAFPGRQPEVVEQAERGGQRGPVLGVRVEQGGARRWRPSTGQAPSPERKAGANQAVGHPLGPQLPAGLEVDGLAQHPRDLRRRGRRPRLLDANADPAGEHDRHAKTASPTPFSAGAASPVRRC